MMVFCKYRPLEVLDLSKLSYKTNSKIEKNLNFIIDPIKNKKVIDILVNDRLYAAEFTEFNDVYECAFYHNGLNDKVLEYIYNKKLDYKNKYICCFSHKNNKLEENLMWAHYANGHRGIRIDFDIRLDNIDGIKKEINYEKNLSFFDENLTIYNNLEKIMTTKLNMWEYEQEYRIISNNKYIDINIESITIGKGFYRNYHSKKDDLKNLVYSLKAIKPNVKIKIYENKYENNEIII